MPRGAPGRRRLHRPGCRDRRHRPRLADLRPGRHDRGTDHERTAGDDVTEPHGIRPVRPACPVRFSALGDINSTDATDAVLRSIADRHDDFTLALGDLSYGARRRGGGLVPLRRPAGSAANHPFELVSGNHESNGENGDIERFARCLPNRLPGLVGTYGRQWYVDQPAAHPLVRVVMISPALDFGHGEWSYDTGTPHHDWLRAAVTGARAAGIPWVVVGMHKPCLSVGNYECDPGADVVDLLLDTGVDLVLTGHEHLYQRTKPLALGPAARRSARAGYDPACVATDGTARRS